MLDKKKSVAKTKKMSTNTSEKIGPISVSKTKKVNSAVATNAIAETVAPKAAKTSARVGAKAVEKDLSSKVLIKKSTESLVAIKPYALKASEEYMNEAQKAHFKEILNTWRTVLSNKLDTAVSQLKDEPKHFADLNDRATQEEEFNLELRARDREADLITDIDEALKRVNEGDYGYCEECGVEIGLRRLEARPTATLCIDCKTLAEMRERQSRGPLPL